jgi:acyl dehydratase
MARASTIFAHSESITDELLAEAREYLGKDLRIEQYNREASFDTIRRYALGIGDDNPLWCDEEYAARSKYRTMVAPPTFFYSIWAPGVAPALGGVQPIHGGTRWEWERPALRGDRIAARAQLVDLKVVEGRHAGRIVVQTGETTYTTDEGEKLAKATSTVLRVPHSDKSEGLRYEAQQERIYTDAELGEIECSPSRGGDLFRGCGKMFRLVRI